MEHLSLETLARLVDDAPSSSEAAHLDRCPACASELAELREQTEALAGLPVMVPPKGDWHVLEARLRSEGLVESPGLFQTLGLAQTPAWMRAAAALVLFLSGTGTGVLLSAPAEGSVDASTVAEIETVEEAASAVRLAADSYSASVSRYRELLAENGGETFLGDPFERYVALEHLVNASQAAVRQAPADPYLNGILTSAMAERDAMARFVSATGANWF